MGRRFNVILEHDGENPVRNDFVCEIDEREFISIKYREDLYSNDMSKYPSKKHLLKTLKQSEGFGQYSWGIDEIVPKIEAAKHEMEVDTQLEDDDKKALQSIIYALDDLYELSIKKCQEHNLPSEKCFLVWWIDY